MKTDDLIRALATDVRPEARVTQGLGLRLALALVVCGALVVTILGLRADLGIVLLNPVSSLRLVLTLGLMAAALQIALQLTRPEMATGSGATPRRWPLMLLAGIAALAIGWALATTPPAAWGTALIGTTAAWCLVSIPLLSILPVWVLMITLRRGATGRPALLGAFAGLAGSGGAAATYALHCIEDSPLFYITWYGLAIAMVTAVSALIGARLLRW